MKNNKLDYKILIIISIVFLFASSILLYVSFDNISNQLLISNEKNASDTAQLLANNFKISDAEVAYMKTLTFNEMEVDPINYRLMNMGKGIDLDADIQNVFIITKLEDNEIKYYAEEEDCNFFGCSEGTALNGIWLLNGKIGKDGEFEVTKRDDKYRYTDLDEETNQYIIDKKPKGTYSNDEWGEFLTGYSPIYTVEGNYVGLLGIDMSMDKYRDTVLTITAILIGFYIFAVFILLSLCWFIYGKLNKSQKAKVYFDFYSRMSHDMRTPMNGIIGMSNLSKDCNDVNELHHYLGKIEESSLYMLKLINDTLDVSKIDDGKMIMNYQGVRLKELLENISDMISSSSFNYHVNYEMIMKGIDDNIIVETDPLRFKQLFVNLLNNALKYTKTDVDFIAEIIDSNDKEVKCLFKVIDNGVGMSKKFIKNQLYKPFSQEHNGLSDKYSGSGLGLNITKNIVDTMSGEIKCESEIDKGTIFTVSLTLNKTVLSNDEKTIDDDYSLLYHKKVLICEDNELNAEIESKILNRVDCSCDIASNGAKGVELFNKSSLNEYDAILMDIRMPQMDGLEATKLIRSLGREDAKIVPIIALTANAYEEDIENSLNAGMNAHLSKPINTHDLYEMLIKLIKERENNG